MTTYQLVVVVAVEGAITAIGTLWLCVKAWRVSSVLAGAGKVTAAAAEQSHESFIQALARIESEVGLSKIANAHTAARIDIATELGYQQAEAAERTEGRDAVVAHDLADAISRADAMPNDPGNYGAAADAALRSPCDTPTEDPHV